MTFSETFLVFLVTLVVFFGVKFGFWESCLCNRNDKYEVCIAVTLFVNMTDDIKWKILLNTKDYQNDIVSRPKRELEPSKFNQSPKDRSKLIWLSAGTSCQSQGLCAIVCEAARLFFLILWYIADILEKMLKDICWIKYTSSKH